VLYAVTQGDQGFVERSNRLEFIEYNKVTVKMSWLFFKKRPYIHCTTLKIVNCLAI